MKKIYLFIAILCFTITLNAKEYYGIMFGTDLEVNSDNMDDIFGDGKAAYDPEFNTLFLEEGFSYSLSKGFVSIDTEQQEFAIRLEGNAEIKAAVKSKVPVRVTSDGPYTLSITSNISGSALECPGLYIGSNTTLNLLSRNSQNDMYALNCTGKLELAFGSLIAEVTTAQLAVKTQQLEMHNCSIIKPKGGCWNSTWGGICYADGTPAKAVQITQWGQGIEQINGQNPKNKARKIIRNGQLLIIRNGKTFNAIGTELTTNN